MEYTVMLEVFLVITACLYVPPEYAHKADCKDYHIADYDGLLHCTMTGSFSVDMWSTNHPDRRVVKWTCEIKE